MTMTVSCINSEKSVSATITQESLSSITSAVEKRILQEIETQNTSALNTEIITGVFKGPYDLSHFDVGSFLDTYTADELMKTISKNDACKIIVTVVSWYNAAMELLLAEKEKTGKLEEQLGRNRETTFGQKSERRSTLDGNSSKTDARNNNSEESHPSDHKTGTAAEKSDKGVMNTGHTNKSTGNEVKEKRAWTPKRKPGCARQVTENVIQAETHKKLSKEQLDKLAKDGKIKKLPDGSYDQIVNLNMTFLVRVTYERAMNKDTGEIIEADSSHKSKLLPGSKISGSLIAQVLYGRTVLALSGPRLAKQFKSWGVSITKQNIYTLYTEYGFALARPLVMRMITKTLEAGKIQSDESWTKIREDLAKECRHNSVLWLLRTSEKLNIPQIIIVIYTGSRASHELAEIIRGFALKLMSDGYSGYTALLKEFADTIELVGCLQHSRSRFVDVIQALKGKKAYKKMSEEERKNLPVNQILDLYSEIFHLENQMKLDMSMEEKKRYRAEMVRPALDRLFEKIKEEAAKLSPKVSDYWSDAINYALKFEDRFYSAVADPEMPLQNSACERVFAGFGILRSNYKQMDTVFGTKALTFWFSIVRTAKENGADEWVYLNYLIENLPAALKEHGDYYWNTPQQLKSLEKLPVYSEDLSYLDQYMPWSEDYRSYAVKYTDKCKDLLFQFAKQAAL